MCMCSKGVTTSSLNPTQEQGHGSLAGGGGLGGRDQKGEMKCCQAHLAMRSKGVTTSKDLLKALSRKALGRRSMTSLADSMALAACSKKGLTKFSTEALTASDTTACIWSCTKQVYTVSMSAYMCINKHVVRSTQHSEATIVLKFGTMKQYVLIDCRQHNSLVSSGNTSSRNRRQLWWDWFCLQVKICAL